MKKHFYYKKSKSVKIKSASKTIFDAMQNTINESLTIKLSQPNLKHVIDDILQNALREILRDALRETIRDLIHDVLRKALRDAINDIISDIRYNGLDNNDNLNNQNLDADINKQTTDIDNNDTNNINTRNIPIISAALTSPITLIIPIAQNNPIIAITPTTNSPPNPLTSTPNRWRTVKFPRRRCINFHD